MDEWEYLLDPVNITGGEWQMDEVNGTMNTLGASRWELVAFTPLPQVGTFMCCYKRRKETD
jgi:hypothetical protein